MEQENLPYIITPKFNFMYEMFMPTGKKLRITTIILSVFVLFYICFLIIFGSTDFAKQIIDGTDISIYGLFNNLTIAVISIFAIKLTIHIVVQVMQYKAIKYTFYDNYLEYEDSFLNQHKKSIRYANIKEIEIRRTVWDRMNGYGMIIIYTNAEKAFGDGLIIYSIKDPQETYNKIDKIVHMQSAVEFVDDIAHIKVEKDNKQSSDEKDFRESLNNKG